MSNSMAAILKNVIRNGGMPLTQVSERIETMYLNGRINAEERLELTELMHEKASPENEKGGWEEMYRTLAGKYRELEARVEAAERALGLYQEPEDSETDAGYPAWEPWDGITDRYQPGAVVVHNGKVWESVYPGQNVWEPGAPGIDERYWKEIVTQEEE